MPMFLTPEIFADCEEDTDMDLRELSRHLQNLRDVFRAVEAAEPGARRVLWSLAEAARLLIASHNDFAEHWNGHHVRSGDVEWMLGALEKYRAERPGEAPKTETVFHPVRRLLRHVLAGYPELHCPVLFFKDAPDSRDWKRLDLKEDA